MEESGIQSGSTGSARVEPPARINNVFLDELITLNMKLFLSSLPTLTVSLFVSFRPVYTGRGTVGLLLTKKTQNKKNDKKKTNHKSHPRNFTSLQKPFFRALCLAAAPPPFVSAGRTLVTAHVFFLFFHCGFFFSPRGEGRSLCHIINSNSVSVLFSSVADMETMTKLPRVSPHPPLNIKSWSWSVLL